MGVIFHPIFYLQEDLAEQCGDSDNFGFNTCKQCLRCAVLILILRKSDAGISNPCVSTTSVAVCHDRPDFPPVQTPCTNCYQQLM